MLKVVCKEDSQDVLVGFPFDEEQFLTTEEYDSNNQEKYEFVVLSIEGVEETSEAQEAFLNASDDVISYCIE